LTPLQEKLSCQARHEAATGPSGHILIYNAKAMDDREMNLQVQRLRDRLDEVDRDLVRALNERARLVQELAILKREVGMPLFDPKREEEILQRIAEENPGPITMQPCGKFSR
jgi:chorismate mutase